MKSKTIILAFTILCLLTSMVKQSMQKDKLFRYDVSGYHLYLPAVFIYHDLATLSFYDSLHTRYQISDLPWYSITEMPDGKRLNKYTFGVAIFELPFFLIAHAYNTLTKAYPIDGYSLPYQYGAIISNIFWSVLGLIYIRRLLKQYYKENIVSVTILAIGFGTNLYYYNAYSLGMSHPYSFFLFAAGLFHTDQWYRTFKDRHLLAAALTVSLITITRPINGIFILVPIFWSVGSVQNFRERCLLFISKWKPLLVAGLLFAAVISLQLVYWKYITGNWLYYSYGEESFCWASPRVFDGLFGFRKGWFIYSPVLIFAIFGFYALWKHDRAKVPILFVFLCLIVHVTFSWCHWWYGGGFGARSLLDIIPVMSIPLAAFCNTVFSRKREVLRYGFTAIVVLLSALSMFQSYQAVKNIIHYDRMSWAYYWRVFGRLSVDEKDFDLLLDERTYWREMGRNDRK